ncbi:MAG: hypothetical protein KDC95_02720 [Planctomycetes bacterium]|nr:hypothetical protein [Planctomycetota bacterium]
MSLASLSGGLVGYCLIGYLVHCEHAAVAARQPKPMLGKVLGISAKDSVRGSPGGDSANRREAPRSASDLGRDGSIVETLFEDDGLAAVLERELERGGFDPEEVQRCSSDAKEALAELRATWQAEVARDRVNPLIAAYGDLWFELLPRLEAATRDGQVTIGITRRESPRRSASFRIQPGSPDHILQVETRPASIEVRLLDAAALPELVAPVREALAPLFARALQPATTGRTHEDEEVQR